MQTERGIAERGALEPPRHQIVVSIPGGISPSAVSRIFACIAVVLGLLQAWSSRMSMVNDTVSYLDMGDYIFSAQWSKVVNGVWNPLYAGILGLTLHVFHPSTYWQYPAVHLLLFSIFLFAAWCFDFFLRGLLALRQGEEKNNLGLSGPVWAYLTIGYALFFWSSLALIRVSETNPDMLVAAFFYLGCGFLVRIKSGNAGWPAYLALGSALGLGYLTKSIMFPVAVLCLGVALLMDLRSRRKPHRAIGAVAVFLALSVPFISALSIARSKPTFGESGVYNYLVHVNHVPARNWQGWNGDTLTLLHPTQQIWAHPPTFKFADSVPGSYPGWYDPSYWYQGANPRYHLRAIAAGAFANLADLSFLLLLAFNGALCSGLFLLFYASGRGWRIFHDIGGLWFLLVPSVAALILYALVHVETRYVAPFLVVLISSLCFSIRIRPSSQARHLFSGMALLLVLMFFCPLGPGAIHTNVSSLPDLLKFPRAGPNRNEDVVNALQAIGLNPGEKIASLEDSNCANRFTSCEGVATWARLGHFKVAAEVNYSPENEATRGNNFWDANADAQRGVLEALAQSGARAVLSRQVPRGANAQGWQQVGNTPYYLHWL